MSITGKKSIARAFARFRKSAVLWVALDALPILGSSCPDCATRLIMSCWIRVKINLTNASSRASPYCGLSCASHYPPELEPLGPAPPPSIPSTSA